MLNEEEPMALTVEHVSRRFGPVVACSDVSLRVDRGEVVALLGENGAGKSTLLSIIAGFVAPDSGEVRVDGKLVPSADPGAAIASGIGTAFQHGSLSPELTVEANFALSHVRPEGVHHALPASLSLDTPVKELSVPERQQVEFAKARALAGHVLLLDEPTSPLGGVDVERMLEGIRDTAQQGAGVLFVTHRLREALAVADRIVVMRRGWVVDRFSASGGTWPSDIERQVLAAMFGDVHAGDSVDEVVRDDHAIIPPAGTLRVTGTLGGERSDISLELGRVLAVAGIAGNGQADLVALLSGQTATEVRVRGGGQDRKFTGSGLRAWFRREVAVVPEDRMHWGGATSMSLRENLALRELASGRMGRFGWISRRGMDRRSREMIADWDIQPSDPGTRFGSLSGGNTQRVLLARALDPLPTLLVAERPTNGLDHHSIQMVREQLRHAADHGVAVVVIEQDLDDALEHADRVAIMANGALSEPTRAHIADRSTLQQLMVHGWNG